MSHKDPQLEQLLSLLGSPLEAVSEDLEHRYALRRALLNSPLFCTPRRSTTLVFPRVFFMMTGVVAGTFVCLLVVISVSVSVVAHDDRMASHDVSSSAMVTVADDGEADIDVDGLQSVPTLVDAPFTPTTLVGAYR